MTRQIQDRVEAPRRRGRGRTYVLLLIAAAGGVYAGVQWQGRIAPLLGMGVAPSGDAGSQGSTSSDSQQLWTCGMHPQVIQDRPGDCPICHMKLTPLNVGSGSPQPGGRGHDHAATAGEGQRGREAERRVKYWWDPMLSPPYISDRPGKSPMGMDLVPVYEDDVPVPGVLDGTGAVVIDPAVVQNMGIRVSMVTQGPLTRRVRLVGYLDEAQPNASDINLLVSGWVRRLYADTEGMHVKAGDPLFDLYSPELQIAIEELIASRRARGLSAAGGDVSEGDAMGMAASLYDATVRKLELLGLPRAQIEALAKRDRAPDTVTFVSPITGDVTEKSVVEGSAVKAGDRVLRIVDFSTLWVDGQVFERDLPFVHVGQRASASIASRPGEPINGEIVFVDPRVNESTRTAVARMSIPNPDRALKPGMYATVRLDSLIAENAVLAPREAIIDTGESQVAFVAEAVGRFQPRRVKMGLASEGGLVQVIEGLAPGEAVVTSGQFLVDSESRLREAIQKFLNEKKAPVAKASDPGARVGIKVTPEQQEREDALVLQYLAIAERLGNKEPEGSPPSVDVAPLIAAARALQAEAAGGGLASRAADVIRVAETMKDQPITRQRELFGGLSDLVIALVETAPQSSAVAGTLFVVHCPMAPGSWLQRTEDIANPYYASEMKRCGEVVKVIDANREAHP
ncbi:MAG: efflux RND transporter periplasmic adaptor subunit [Phycisphaeraceae bacterium]|nr:efflux RND transporter periplasmic adaptor subunit [Phycisphaeraceae bacterium]